MRERVLEGLEALHVAPPSRPQSRASTHSRLLVRRAPRAATRGRPRCREAGRFSRSTSPCETTTSIAMRLRTCSRRARAAREARRCGRRLRATQSCAHRAERGKRASRQAHVGAEVHHALRIGLDAALGQRAPRPRAQSSSSVAAVDGSPPMPACRASTRRTLPSRIARRSPPANAAMAPRGGASDAGQVLERARKVARETRRHDARRPPARARCRLRARA